jgi:nitrogen regulatory protein P-II 1
MKKIEAYIKPDKLEDIKEALKAVSINGLSISQIMGCGNQMGWKEFVRGSEVDYNFLPKLKIELVVLDNQVETVIKKISEVSQSGDVGDGKIFVSEVLDAVRIRTGERGNAAIIAPKDTKAAEKTR